MRTPLPSFSNLKEARRKGGESEVAVDVSACYVPLMMNRYLCAFLAAFAGLFVASAVDAAETKPNVVFILTDDLGWNELGCYGQTKIKTPRVDSLARDGMKFTQAYSGNAEQSGDETGGAVSVAYG